LGCATVPYFAAASDAASYDASGKTTEGEKRKGMQIKSLSKSSPTNC